MGYCASKEDKEPANHFFPNNLQEEKDEKLHKNNSNRNCKKRINKPPFNKYIFEFKTDFSDSDEEETNEESKPKRRLSQKTQEMLRKLRHKDSENHYRFDITM